MAKLNHTRLAGIAVTCIFLLAPAVFAQAPEAPIEDQPQPVLVTEPIQTQVTVDEQPLTGGEDIGYGSWGPRRSFVTPSIRLVETLDSNPLMLQKANEAYKGYTSFAGDAQLVRYFGRDAEIRYAGAVRYDTNAQYQNSEKFTNTHDLLISKRIPWGKVGLVFDNETLYSSDATFGSSGMAGLGGVISQLWGWSGLSNVQLGANAIRTDLLPSQAILTGHVGRVSNTSLAEADVPLNSRDIVTIGGTFSLLHFMSTFYDTHQISGIAGFNHTISSRNSVAIESMVTRVTLVDTPTSVDAAEFTFLYGRTLTGKLSFDAGAGPLVIRTNKIITNQGTSSETDWQGRAGLRYRTQKAQLALHAERRFTSGSGVLQGGISSGGQGTATFSVSRSWTAALSFGIAHTAQPVSPQKYNTQYTGIVFSRHLGVSTSIYTSYDFERQTSGNCTGQTCLYSGVRNVFGIGLVWTPKPISLE